MILARPRRKHPHLSARNGFVLVDLLIGLGVILVVGAAAIVCMMQLNKQAEIHRFYSYGSTALQNQIRQSLTDAPYYPQSLVTGTGLSAAEIPASLSSTTEAITLSSDPLVTGTLSTTVTYPVNTGNSSLYVARVAGSFVFTYRSRNYTIVANTLRASDL